MLSLSLSLSLSLDSFFSFLFALIAAPLPDRPVSGLFLWPPPGGGE